MLNGYEPAATVLVLEIVRTVVAEGVAGLGENEAVNPVGSPVVASVTALLNPPMEVKLTVMVAVLGAQTVVALGEAAMV